MNPHWRLQNVVDQVSTVILGQAPAVRDALACCLAGGHLLLEDLPGVGKTTLAQALAASLGLAFGRVQCTADLLPADLIGTSLYRRESGDFIFQPGPVFSPVLLVDELNRAGPRTQSALLEAMEERQVSVDGRPRPLPAPFFVIATQNPQDQAGTHPLPESQLDRFLMRLSLGLPPPEAERILLRGGDRRAGLAGLQAQLDAEGLRQAQAAVRAVQLGEPALDYLQALLAATRDGRRFVHGLSPRAGLGLLRAAQARALLDGRDHLLPDDLQALLPACAAHRLRPRPGQAADSAHLLRELVELVPVP